MCGIFGAFSLSSPTAAARIDAGVRALRHRGPDGEGRWIDGRGRDGLGHTRLALVDRAGGAQPIRSEDEQVIAVVSGELYDEAILRADLEARGHRLRSRSDSELVVHLYEEHGPAFLGRLRGEFALLLWDARLRLGLAARDRFGVRPLVYTAHDGGFLFASEAKALFAAGAPAAWDHEALLVATQLHYTPPARTLFRGIYTLEPGHFALIVGDQLRLRRYWDLDFAREAEIAAAPAIDDDEAARRIDAALDEAVRIRLRAEAPICFQLSGGLDSSVVLALARPHLAGSPVAYTVAFADADYDERHLAEETASFLGAELRVIEASAAALAERLPAAIAHGEGLCVNAHVAAKHLLSQAIRADGFGVVLTGEGADELFGGYAHLRRDLYLAGGDAAGLAGLGAGNQASAGSMLPSGDGLDLGLAERLLGGPAPTFLRAKATLGRRVAALLRDDALAARAGRDAFAIFLADFDLPRDLGGRDPVRRALTLWIRSALATYILRTLGDGMEMAHAVEGRLPFLDHHLFAAARALPLDRLIRDRVEKFILRRAIGDRIPAAIRSREKHPFLAPPLAAEAPIQALLRGEDLPEFVDRRRLRAALDRLLTLPRAQQIAEDPALMLIASTVILQRSYRL